MNSHLFNQLLQGTDSHTQKFLGCPVSDVPFPRRNDTAQFHAMLARNSKRVSMFLPHTNCTSLTWVGTQGLLRWIYGVGTAAAIVASLALARKRM